MNALVLSAGGMFGAWQAGAWQALSSVFQPDLIVGASVGALNGWLVASGCSAEEMAVRWAANQFDGAGAPASGDDGFPLPGIVSGWPVLNLTRRLVREFEPRMPMALVCTQFPQVRARIFQTPDLTADHLYASCAVPVILPARRLPDGGVYGDGGFLGPLPLWAAAQLGATRILAIHVLPPMPFWLDWKLRAVRSLARHDERVSEGVEVVRVGPAEVLGSFRDSAVWDAGRSERWLREGRKAGEQAAARLE